MRRLALSKSLSEGFRDYSINRVRPPDYDRALELLQGIEMDRLAPYPALQMNLIEARGYTALNQEDRAAAAANRVVEIMQANPPFRSEVELALQTTPMLRDNIDMR